MMTASNLEFSSFTSDEAGISETWHVSASLAGNPKGLIAKFLCTWAGSPSSIYRLPQLIVPPWHFICMSSCCMRYATELSFTERLISASKFILKGHIYLFPTLAETVQNRAYGLQHQIMFCARFRVSSAFGSVGKSSESFKLMMVAPFLSSWNVLKGWYRIQSSVYFYWHPIRSSAPLKVHPCWIFMHTTVKTRAAYSTLNPRCPYDSMLPIGPVSLTLNPGRWFRCELQSKYFTTKADFFTISTTVSYLWHQGWVGEIIQLTRFCGSRRRCGNTIATAWSHVSRTVRPLYTPPLFILNILPLR